MIYCQDPSNGEFFADPDRWRKKAHNAKVDKRGCKNSTARELFRQVYCHCLGTRICNGRIKLYRMVSGAKIVATLNRPALFAMVAGKDGQIYKLCFETFISQRAKNSYELKRA
jgi:hypothetical protein